MKDRPVGENYGLIALVLILTLTGLMFYSSDLIEMRYLRSLPAGSCVMVNDDAWIVGGEGIPVPTGMLWRPQATANFEAAVFLAESLSAIQKIDQGSEWWSTFCQPVIDALPKKKVEPGKTDRRSTQ